MKTYYCVCTSYDNRGRVVSNILDTVEATRRPGNSYKSTSRKIGLVRFPERRQGPCKGGSTIKTLVLSRRFVELLTIQYIIDIIET